MSAASSPVGAAGSDRGHEPGLSPRWIAAIIILPIVVGLVALFGFRTLYQLWCRQTGTALRPNDPAVAALLNVHTGRYIKVWFESRVDDGLPVDFGPVASSVMDEVGMDGRTDYRITNRSDHQVRIRPVHYIAPINAASDFGMKVCFCFNDLTLDAHESRTYPVIFSFAPRLDARIHTVTICYTLFSLDGGEDEVQLNRRIEKTVRDRGGIVSPRHPPAGEAAPTPSQPPTETP
jgi:cytochrome c oxidase assembly protein subunit 11